MSSPEFTESAAAVGELLAKRPLIRAINFHNTPRSRVAEYERQLDQCSRHFCSVDERDLERYLRTGRWHKPKPGMIVALYEGYRNHYEVFLPLLKRYGMVGWFFVITGFVKSPPSEQLNFAAQHSITTVPNEYLDGRYAISWSELREVDQFHVVASHARTHTRLSALNPAALEGEVAGSQRDFEEYLGHPVRSFVSFSGPPYGEYAPADRLVDAANYQFVFSNFRIQRLRDWA